MYCFSRAWLGTQKETGASNDIGTTNSFTGPFPLCTHFKGCTSRAELVPGALTQFFFMTRNKKYFLGELKETR